MANEVGRDAFRVAIADGASESWQAGPWAQLLVEAFTKEEPAAWPTWIPRVQSRWKQHVAPSSQALPWFVEERAKQGAFATFLGVVIDEDGWQAVAVGDSCLFCVREDQLALAFPLTQSSDFGNTPWLIGSRTSADKVPREQAQWLIDDRKPGDRLFLMTDALAQWFLRETESGRRPWRDPALTCNANDAFAERVVRLRAEHGLRNDDTTLVVIGL